MKVFVRSDIGKVRPINEDAYYAPAKGECFCAIADGMGGHNAGEVASAMAVSIFSEKMRSANETDGQAMRRAVERANARIHEKSMEADQCNGMGTTFTALAFAGGNAHIAHVGDSRAYLLRNGTIMRLTLDHTLVEEMVLKGVITPREAKYHPKRNYITRALGTMDTVEVDLIQVELLPGDVFFLCTDGLSNHVEDKKILEIAQMNASWEDKVNIAVNLALEAGGSDNITAMFALCEEDHK